MIKGKPVLRSGQDRKDLPTYTIAEAARFLGISGRTARYWYSEQNEILRPSAHCGHTALLSFRDLTEAYVLTLLTKFYGFPLSELRRIVVTAKEETGLERPFVEADLKVLFRNLLFEKATKGRRSRQVIDLAHSGNLVFPEFADQLGRRILRDHAHSPSKLFPWRLVAADDDSRPVSMDPDVVSGRLVVSGTRIPVTVLLAKRIKGRSEEELASAYQISTESVRKALLHIDRPIHPKAA